MNAAAPSHDSTARADPALASAMDTASTGTPSSTIVSAVPRADPFMTAVPCRTPGTRNVSKHVTATVAASKPDSQYATPPRRSTAPVAPAAGRDDRLWCSVVSLIAITWIPGSQWWVTGGPGWPVHSLTIMFAMAMNTAPAATPMMTSLVSAATAIPRATAMPVSTVFSRRWRAGPVVVIVVLLSVVVRALGRAVVVVRVPASVALGAGVVTVGAAAVVLRQASCRLSLGPLCRMALV